MVDHWRNCCRHCMTETDEVHRTMHDLRIVVAAVMPTKVLPAPHGKTMMPDRARLSKGIGPRVRTAFTGTSEPRLTRYQTSCRAISPGTAAVPPTVSSRSRGSG